MFVPDMGCGSGANQLFCDTKIMSTAHQIKSEINLSKVRSTDQNEKIKSYLNGWIYRKIKAISTVNYIKIILTNQKGDQLFKVGSTDQKFDQQIKS